MRTLALSLFLSLLATATHAQVTTTKEPDAVLRADRNTTPVVETLPYVQDTSERVMRYVGRFQGGYKAVRHDGKMGVLHEDLSIRVPFIYNDIQAIPTGIHSTTDYLLIAQKDWHGKYATLGESGEATSDFVLSFNPRLRIFPDCIVDSPKPDQYYVRHRDGRPSSTVPFTAVWPHPILMSAGYHVLSVRRANSPKLAVFDMAADEEVTPYCYDRINRVGPVVGDRTHVPLLEAYIGFDIVLLRPNGEQLTDLRFSGVEDYNNWRQLRDYFGLPDDPTAEALAWTKDLRVYVVYEDDRVELLGTYGGN